MPMGLRRQVLAPTIEGQPAVPALPAMEQLQFAPMLPPSAQIDFSGLAGALQTRLQRPRGGKGGTGPSLGKSGFNTYQADILNNAIGKAY